jgi:type I restriction enzyme S subunit
MMPRDDKNTSVFVDGDLSHAESRRGGEFFSRKERIDRKGWKRVRLGDVCEISKGEQLNRTTLAEKGIIPVYNGGSSPSGYTEVSNTDAENVIISEGGNSCGFVNFIHVPFWRGGHCYLLKTKINKSLLYYVLKANEPKIMALRVGTGLPNIQRERLNAFEFDIPTDNVEQKQLVSAFTSIDTHISALQSLIAKYEAIKKATVNLLLKPKAGWREKSLGDLAFIKTGGRNTQDAVASGQYPFFVRSPKVERINTYSFDGEAVLVAGDGVGAGKVFHYINGKHDCHQRVYRVRDFSPDILGRFVYRVLSEQFPVYMERCNDKASVDSLRLPAFKSFPVYYPDIDEQRRIVGILDSIDGTINGLKSQLAKAKDIKQGMMSYFFG